MGESKDSDVGSVGLIFEGEVLDYHSSSRW
jgi:hypothetical protein